MELETIYQDDDIIVVNKPAGVSVTRDRTGAVELAELLREQLGANTAGKLRLVHRLDKDTSGVLLLAKNIEAQRILCRAFEQQLVTKSYIALVRGQISEQEGIINLPLVDEAKNNHRVFVAQKKGRPAATCWKVVAKFGSVGLLLVRPVTGRRHQIRVHLASVGMRLAVDPLYSSPKPLYLSQFKTEYHRSKDKAERALIDRLTLHSYQLDISPKVAKAGGRRFVAGLDRKFAATIKMLNKHSDHRIIYEPSYIAKFLNAEAIQPCPFDSSGG